MYGFPSPVRILRGTAAIGAVVAAVLVPAGPAVAGGPTSVVLVAPSGATASLYVTDSEYGLLHHSLGENPAPEAGAPGGGLAPSGARFTITWLIHDVAVWRVDQFATPTDANPWILTRFSVDDAITLGESGVWHHAADPTLLVNLLDRLGLLDGSTTRPVAAAEGAAPAAVTPAVGAGEPTDTDAPAVWPWLLPGLLAGGLLGAVGRPAARLVLRARRRAQRAGPRQQVIDV